MKNKILAVVLSAIVLLYFGVLPVHAETAKKTVDGIDVNGAVYAPVDAIITDMGGTAKLDKDKFYTFAINNKKLYIPTTLSFAEVDGKFVPYGTKTVGGFTVPVYAKPVEKDGEVYVPADFLKSSMGLNLSVKDDKITFDAKSDDAAAGAKTDTDKANSSDEKTKPDEGNDNPASDETKSGTDKTNSSDDTDTDKANSSEGDKSTQNADSNGSQSDSNDNSSGSSSGTITAPTPPKAPTAPTAPKVPAAGTK